MPQNPPNLPNAGWDATPPKSIRCPHCGQRILIFVKNPQTGEIDTCPNCGQKANHKEVTNHA